MADSIADLAAHLGLDVDKGSFDAAREALDSLAKVEMGNVIAQANEMAKATAKATGEMIASMVRLNAETSRNALKAVEVIGLQMPAALKKTEHAAEEAGHKFSWLHHVIGVAAFLHFGHVIEGWAHHAIKAGAAMGDLADKTGTSVEEIQELGYAAQIHGLSTDFMANTLGKLATNLDKAAKKGKEAAEPFVKAGIAIKDAEGKARPAADVFGDVADRLKSLSEEERPAEAVKLLGKAGRELIPLLKEGSEGLEKLRKEARDLGLVMSKETIESMDKVEKNTRRLGKAWEGIKEHAVAALIPEIQKLTDSLLKWYDANKEDVAHVIHEVFSLILVVVKALAKALMILIKVGAFLIKNWKTLAVILGSLAVAYGILHAKAILAGLAMFKAGITAAAGWLVAAAPLIALTALIAGIILLVQDFYVWMKGGKSVLGEAFGNFEDNGWAQGLVKAFNLVVDSVKWIVDKIVWVLDKAKEAYEFIAGESQLTAVPKRMAKAREMGLKGDEAVEYAKTGFTKAQITPQIDIPASSDTTAGMAPVNITTTNTITVNGGDPEKMKQAAEEVLAKDRRQLEATIGGGKKR